MADKKISELTLLDAVDVDTAADLIPIVDMSEPDGDKNKHIPPEGLVTALQTLLAEIIDDRVAALLLGSGINLTYNDGANTLTLSLDASALHEMIDDRVAALLQAGANVTLTYDDVTGALEVAASGPDGTGLTQEQIEDFLGGSTFQPGAGITITYNDAGGTITIAIDAASSGDINTGTNSAKPITPDAFAGSNFGRRVVEIPCTDPAGAAITVADGIGYFVVTPEFNGMNLVDAQAAVVGAVSTSGDPTFQVANVTDAVDMLTTKITIDANEVTSYGAATPSVIDATKDDVATGDVLRIDCDVAGTGAKGVIAILTFQLP